MTIPAASSLTQPADMAQSRCWMGNLHASPAELPFSFRYAGESITGLPASWHPVVSSRRLEANLEETVYLGTDGSGLTIRVEVLRYYDFPVVEWVIWFANDGKEPTPLLSDIQAIATNIEGEASVLSHGNGDFYSEEGYTPCETPLPEGTVLTFAPNGGRPCDGAFPYFRLQQPGRGLTLAIGWPAQWSATFTGVADGVVIQAGQQQTHLSLQPGERIRTPRITVLSWTGEATRGINLWRRWYRAHILPRPDGQALSPLLALAATDAGEEFTGATVENQLRYQQQFLQRGIDFDVWWIDAGWYPCRDEQGERRWWRTGTWAPDPERFPHGLKAIAEQAAQHHARLLLWFEPERVTPGSQLFQDHPEWLLQDDTKWDALLNLGNAECRQWLTDYVCELIRHNGIGIYRQDFNFEPLSYWRNNEPEERRGMQENLHVQGYLHYWDDLLARNPGLWIDSCASGGRRNDLETMRRSVPLHYSDYGYGDLPVKVAFHHTLYAWLPYFKEVMLAWDQQQPEDDRRYEKTLDRFAFHCGLAPMFMPAIDIHREDYDDALGKELIAIWRRAAPFLLHGDYYPLTPFSRSAEQWVVWQFDRPEYGDGLLQGLRHTACPEETYTAYPHGLQPDAEYLFENPETGEQFHRTGAEVLRDGLTLALPRRSGVIWFYRTFSLRKRDK